MRKLQEKFFRKFVPPLSLRDISPKGETLAIAATSQMLPRPPPWGRCPNGAVGVNRSRHTRADKEVTAPEPDKLGRLLL